jgi:ABC-type Na+ efflux pump permease subunit
MMRVARLIYAAMGVLWLALALILVHGSAILHAIIGLMCAVQVAVGLLVLSVGTATSLAEERARGSLDLLLSTPIAARSILIGKWWGAFRPVCFSMIWAALIAGVLVAESGRCWHYALLLALILSYAAVVTSLGLAAATWVSRLGRAVALCVTAYIVLSIGWIILAVLLPHNDSWSLSLCMGSPIFGTLWAACGVTDTPVAPNPTEYWPATLFWDLTMSGAAAILFAATVATFDRCLGRVARRPDARSTHFSGPSLSKSSPVLTCRPTAASTSATRPGRSA